MLGLFVPTNTVSRRKQTWIVRLFRSSRCRTAISFQSPANLARSDLCRCFVSRQRLLPQQRQDLAIQVLARTETVSELARQHEVSRKFLYQRFHTAEEALSEAFARSSKPDDVFFYLPVTKAWLRQLVLGLVLICHCYAQ